MGRALRHRNYRLFFGGQGISLIGTWLTRVATSWLVYRISGSSLALGVVSFAGLIPIFILAPVTGVWVDRWNRHRVLIFTQSLSLLQSAALAWLALRGVITIPQIVVLSVLQGMIDAFDMPARQAFVVELIEDRRDLPNAIALNSTMFNAARLIGPSIAGILIATVGEGGCFAIDALSYLGVLISLLMMKVRTRTLAPKSKRVLHEFAEGFRYAMGSVPIRSVLALIAVVSLTGMPYTVLLPVLTRELLHGGADALGFLTAASGLGALLGALYLASRSIIAGSAAVFGAGISLFALSHSMILSLALMFATGLGMMVGMAASNTILQTLVDEDKRGRLMSLYTLAFAGMAPFGSLFAGSVAERIGAPGTLIISGGICVLASLIFMRGLPRIREQIRPIYRKLGILPAIASGIRDASEMGGLPKG